MEFNFNINNLFGNEICLIDKELTPYRTSPLNIREYKAQLCQVLDKMGDASAKAQGLHGAITTAHRLQLTDHHLYMMKDASANGGKGAVVGFIKTGHKRLFIYDHNGVNHEMEPLCTLDFYVHESRQRTGCGRKLFEFMLKAEGVQPYQLAIDRPSHKFLAFLNKHYKLKTAVPQVNNFVVFEHFFRSVSSSVDKHKSSPQKPPIHPYRKLNSRELNGDGIISRLSDLPSRPTSGGIVPLSREKIPELETTESPYLPPITADAVQTSVGSVINSSTTSSPMPVRPNPLIGCTQSPNPPLRLTTGATSRIHSAPILRDFDSSDPFFLTSLANSKTDSDPSLRLPSMSDSASGFSHPMRHVSSANILAWDEDVPKSMTTSAGQKEVLSNVPLQRQNSSENGRTVDRRQNAITGQMNSVAPLAMGAHSAQYSRHGSTPPTPSSQNDRYGNGLLSSQYNGANNTVDSVTLDVSKRIIGGRDPPLRHRDGPSEDYCRLFTTDSYQDRHGHLKVAPLGGSDVNSYKRNGFNYQKSKSSPTVVMTTSNNSLPSDDPFANTALKSQTLGSGWNVFGVPPNPRSVNYAKYHQTKLW
ncbi:hypothetical protein LSH36_49g06061 [Paralvinella palmiformis]|uniref:Alpha-tubulin N-acetyltransferase n=1 Tax=Paralvinella palmiformis TaxID=53620 RepID=A0AAD9K7K4_9ANNE|nr:hypothetical protein LSH36_49g06061 [Paralvinella palmiformis]